MCVCVYPHPEVADFTLFFVAVIAVNIRVYSELEN